MDKAADTIKNYMDIQRLSEKQAMDLSYCELCHVPELLRMVHGGT